MYRLSGRTLDSRSPLPVPRFYEDMLHGDMLRENDGRRSAGRTIRRAGGFGALNAFQRKNGSGFDSSSSQASSRAFLVRLRRQCAIKKIGVKKEPTAKAPPITGSQW